MDEFRFGLNLIRIGSDLFGQTRLSKIKMYTYYDGKSSQPNEANAQISGEKLVIDFAEKQEIWQISAIKFNEFTGKGKTILKYGEFPYQYLEIPIDDNLMATLENLLPKRKVGFRVFADELASSGFRGVLLSMAVFVAIALGFYFFALPKLAEILADQIPVSAEITLGDKIYEQFIKDSPFTPFEKDSIKIDEKKTKLLNDFAKKIDFQSQYPIKITVLKDSIVNAFALPGGHIVVFDGILKKIKSQEELTALLSHEVSHVKFRHSLKGLARSVSGYLFVSILTSDINGLTAVLVDQADGINQLSFTRDLEQDADLNGLKIMYHNKIEPTGMLKLMERLQEESKKYGGENIPKFMSSHPLTKDRIDYIKKEIKGKTGIQHEDLEKIWVEIQ